MHNQKWSTAYLPHMGLLFLVAMLRLQAHLRWNRTALYTLDIIEFNFGSYYYFLLFCFLMKRHFREIILAVRSIILSLLKCIHALLTVSWVLGKKEFRLNSKAQIKQAVWVTKQTRLKSFCIRLSALFRHSVKR